MSNFIQTAGVFQIHSSTATGAGEWWRVHEKIGHLSFQVLHTGSSVGVNLSSVVGIQVSNDATYPVGTVLGTITQSTVASPACDGVTSDAGWGYVRANTSSLSTGTVTVTVHAQWRS